MAGSQLARKRRRTRASTAAEEAASKRQHLERDSEDRAADAAPDEAQPTKATEDIAQEAKPEQEVAMSHQYPTGHAANEPDTVAAQTHGEPEQNEWTSTQTDAGTPDAQRDAGAAAMNVTYMTSDRADPGLQQIRVQSLPVLENLAVQILESLAKGTHQETLTLVAEPSSVAGQAYTRIRSLFEQAKKLYSTCEPFLSAVELNLHTPECLGVIRKANLATFVSSVFGSQDVGFYHLNEYFLETFVPDGGRLLKSQGGLYLDLKTQAYISALSKCERSREEILDDLFPQGLEARLLSRRPGAKQLAPSEIDFVKRARSRRDHLLNEPNDKAAIAALPAKYVWEDFLRDLSGYVSKSVDELIGSPTPRTYRGRPSAFPMGNQGAQHSEQPTIAGLDRTEPDPDETLMQRVLQAFNQGIERQQVASQEATERLTYPGQVVGDEGATVNVPSEARPADEPHIQSSLSPTTQDAESKLRIAQSFGGMPDIPYHTQTAPTQVLYERARLAATAKASPNNRRAGLPSQRRPWTTEEENALMAGLDRVKGPHWSQILAMFGAGGTINESLKDRNQVQLKDKARNLKLFFLKSGIEVPYYLQFVTGELKTRAPGQAAKNEAKDEARMRGDEDRAHVEGVLALASGGRSNADGLELSNDQHVTPQLQTCPAPTHSALDERPGISAAVPNDSHLVVG